MHRDKSNKVNTAKDVEVICLLKSEDFASRLSVSQSSLSAWRRNGILVRGRDCDFLPSTREQLKYSLAAKNIRCKWP